ncbi:MAG: hypothetical protein VX463_18040 [Pseudomonadota bacterium]|nr:hypothetical protein [Pseudomonadota bacterium]
MSASRAPAPPPPHPSPAGGGGGRFPARIPPHPRRGRPAARAPRTHRRAGRRAAPLAGSRRPSYVALKKADDGGRRTEDRMSGLTGMTTARAVLRLSGPEARDFLQDLVTNDVSPARTRDGAAVWAALLTPQGKYLSDFFVLEDPAAPGALLVDAPLAQGTELAKRLMMYRLRRKVEIAAAGLDVALLWGGDAAPGTPPETPAGAILVPDPRAPSLGWRLYAPDPAAALAATGAAPAAPEAYAALRIAARVPEAGAELGPDSYILEAGFERLNGVDFRKGCYVGQEIVARMKHKTELRRRLMRVAVTGEAPPPGTEILTEEGRAAGLLGAVAGGEGLALLRLDRAGGPLTAGDARLAALPDPGA